LDEAARVAGSLVQALKDAKTDPFLRTDLAKTLSALAARMESGEASKLCAAAAGSLVQTLKDPKTDPSRLAAVAEALSALAARMESGEASKLRARAAGTLVRLMSKSSTEMAREDLAVETVVALTGFRPTPSAATATIAVGSLADGSNWPLTLAVLALVNPPCRLSTEQLVDLLKDPLCVGKGRRLILDQLEIRYQRKFADHWTFIRFAQNELKIDTTGPPAPR
jgi:hypothetical protein